MSEIERRKEDFSFTLEDRHKIFFAKCLAEFKTYDETIALFLHDFKRELIRKLKTDDDGELCFIEDVKEWIYRRANYYWNDPKAHNWQHLAGRLRERWLSGIGDVMLAHKRARIEELQKEFNALPGSYVDKILQSEDGEIQVVRRNTGARVQLLEQIRREMEGENVRIKGGITNVTVEIDERSLTDEQLERLLAGEDPAGILSDATEAGERTEA